VQDGRIYIERINGLFLYELKGTPAEYKAGLDCAIAKGWLILRESGTFVRFTGAPAASPGRIGHDLCCPQRTARRDDRRADIRKEASVIERYNLIVIKRGKILYRSRFSLCHLFNRGTLYRRTNWDYLFGLRPPCAPLRRRHARFPC
jgi:hypothetical protein